MREFGEIAHSEGMACTYRTVVERMEVTKHPEFGNTWAVRVLDLCGGEGMIGRFLVEDCHRAVGALQPDEFDYLVDYVNLDLDADVLRKSPGRTCFTDAVYAFERLREEPPFDYFLAVNIAPKTPNYLESKTGKAHFMDDFSDPTRRILLEAPTNIKIHRARIELLTAALLLKKGGKYVSLGFINDETFIGVGKYIREKGLGLRVESDEKVDLDEATLDAFVKHDAENADTSTKGLKSLYRGNYRLTIRTAQGMTNRIYIKDQLNKEIEDLRNLYSYYGSLERGQA